MFINQLFESAYSDGVSDGIQGRANPRASSIYGPGSDDYHRGYADGVKRGEEQRQARVAQNRADQGPYENMSTAELEQLLADIQQRSNERHAIYRKLRGSDYSFDPKRHLPPNDADLKVQSAADNKAWNTIHQVLGQRKRQGMGEAGSPAQQAAIAIAMKKAGKKPKSEDIDEEKVRLDPKCWTGYHKAGTKMKGGVRVNNCVKNEDQNVAEGAEFGAYYSEQLAQRVFDANPNLDDEDAILNAGYAIAKKEMGSRANGIFRNEDFPSDFVSAYGWLKKNQGVEEAFIAPALSAANAAAEYRRQGAAGGGYRGRIDIPVQSREDYISAGRALKKAAAAAGQKIEYGLSNGVMSVFSDSMTSDELDQFIDSVLDQGVAEADQLPGTPVVSLKDLGDEDNKKNRYGQTMPKKLKKDDPRVKFHKDPKQQGVAEGMNNNGVEVSNIQPGDTITWWYNRAHPDYEGVVREVRGSTLIVYAPGSGAMYQLTKDDIRSHKKGVAEAAPIIVPRMMKAKQKAKSSMSGGMDPAKAQGIEDAQAGKPYNNPYLFRPELGAIGNQEHNMYKAAYDSAKKGVAEVSDNTLTSYLSKVDADSQKHEKDPTKRSAAKRNKSVQGFARAFNKLDARKEKTESSDRDPGALASRAHIASQERKHQAWDEKQKQLEKEFYANHPELDDRHKSVDNLVKEFNEMLSRISK